MVNHDAAEGLLLFNELAIPNIPPLTPPTNAPLR